jgi:hypothetical protein
LLEELLGPGATRRVRRLGPTAPAWANARFLRTIAGSPAPDRRRHLLAWVFATIAVQHGEALAIARSGQEQFGGELFADLTAASTRSLRWAMWRGLPAAGWRRLTRS